MIVTDTNINSVSVTTVDIPSVDETNVYAIDTSQPIDNEHSTIIFDNKNSSDMLENDDSVVLLLDYDVFINFVYSFL